MNSAAAATATSKKVLYEKKATIVDRKPLARSDLNVRSRYGEPNTKERLSMIKGTLSNTLELAFGLVVVFGAAFSPKAALGDDAAATFKTKCSPCHGVDGSGNTPAGKTVKAQDLRVPEIQSKTDAELAKVITDGKGKMPSFKSSLSGDQIKGLVAYIRTLKK